MVVEVHVQLDDRMTMGKSENNYAVTVAADIQLHESPVVVMENNL